MNEQVQVWERLYDKFGLPTVLIVFGILFYTGAMGSPVTETRDALLSHVVATNDLSNELRKLVRLQSVMCVKQASPAECIVALTPQPIASTK